MSKVFVVAELSANHNNSLELAIKTIEAMALSGANAVKVQTFKPESLTLRLNSGLFGPKETGLWKGFTPWDLYSKASLPYEWHPVLQRVAAKNGLIFFSSPFDFEAVEFLDSLGVEFYKIASFEITDIPLIKHCASKMKKLIISTGVAEIKDIELAIDACKSLGNNDITLLKCTSEYPAEIKDANLSTIPDMKSRFMVEVGVSDHTPGYIVPVVAVGLGATVVEKHFILDRSLGGPDAAFSLEPDEFKEMVRNVRNAELALGRTTYDVKPEDKNRRRSIFTVSDVKVGEKFTPENIKSIRPGYGLHPKYLPELIGKKALKDIEAGQPLLATDIENFIDV